MKNVKKTKQNNNPLGKKLVWHSFDAVLKDFSKDKEFRNKYNQEMEVRRLARTIRVCREESKLTQAEVAFRTGMTQSMIARLEKGGQGINIDTLGRVAHALNKKIELV